MRITKTSNFIDIVQSDKSSQTHLESICEVIGGRVCPRCGCGDIYTIESGKRERCPECGHRFTLSSGRWLNEVHLSAKSWLWLIKLFEMELTATKISAEMGISYPTTLKAVTAIRRSIAAASANCKSSLLNPGENMRRAIFCVREHDGIETTSVLPSNRVNILARIEQGYLICANRDVRCNTLLCDGIRHGPADFGRGFPRFRTYLAHPTRTRLFIVERLRKYHGVKDEMLPLYVLEMEYRYNARGDQLFNLLVENICRFVPADYRSAMDKKLASVK